MSNFRTPPDRKYVRQSRPHDFLYDQTYTMPSRKDFLEDAAFGTKSGARVHIKPVYQSMFSELKRDKRNVACLTIPQPNNLENFMPQYDIQGIPVMPMDTGPLPLPRQTDDVTGANRAKYAIRYGEAKYRMHRDSFNFNKLAPEEKKKILQTTKARRSGFISRGMQTEMRDSEAQTDPYSPPYVLPYPGAYPKVLSLIKLTWAKGLPFTWEDILVIERALSRRLLETSDRSQESEADFEKRIKLMEDLETQQWADREKDLQEILYLKMEITTKLIIDYSGKVANDHTLRLERLQEKLRNKNTKQLAFVKHHYFRNLRKLEKKYFARKSISKRNIIKDYTEFDSQIYAPLVRNGPNTDVLNPAPNFEFNLHRDFDAFATLTTSKAFVRRELSFDMDAFKNKMKGCEPTGAERRLEKKLEDIYGAFRDVRGYKKSNVSEYMNLFTGAGNDAQGPTITMQEDTQEGRRRLHCIILQKVARGRVIQRLIRNEMEENMNELIGMKLMFDMDPNCQRTPEGQMQKLINMKKQSEAEASRDTEVKEVLGHLEGETLNNMVDFLDTEMIRLIDERKIHALIIMAERERRRKEAIEAGRRYLEEENRRAMDEMFKQVVGIHQSTVDLYLEDMYIESSDRFADEAARIHVRQLASTINEAAYNMPTEIGDFEREELAADLVSNFMIPELSRLCHREKVDAAGIRYKKAAGQVVDAIFSSHAVTEGIADTEIFPFVKAYIACFCSDNPKPNPDPENKK